LGLLSTGGRQVKDGITFQIIDEQNALLEDSPANERTSNKHRIKLDIADYKRLMEQALRGQVEFIIKEENYNDKIKVSVDRMIELAVKSVHNRIEKIVADEVEKLVKERVAAMVQGLAIGVQVNVEDGK
jgi:hypothetical protein